MADLPPAVPCQERKVYDAFARVTQHTDGYLKRGQLKALAKVVLPQVTDSEVALLVEQVDPKSSGRIHYRDLCSWVFARESAAGEPRGKRLSPSLAPPEMTWRDQDGDEYRLSVTDAGLQCRRSSPRPGSPSGSEEFQVLRVGLSGTFLVQELRVALRAMDRSWTCTPLMDSSESLFETMRTLVDLCDSCHVEVDGDALAELRGVAVGTRVRVVSQSGGRKRWAVVRKKLHGEGGWEVICDNKAEPEIARSVTLSASAGPSSPCGRRPVVLDLDRSSGEPLGILVDTAHWTLLDEPRSGLVARWNADYTNKPIAANDRVIEVNGTNDPSTFGEELRKLDVLNIKVEKAKVKGLQVFSWNVCSPQFASNPLAMIPGDGVLNSDRQRTLDALLQNAQRLMFVPERSPKLSELLCGARDPLAAAGDLETTPLDPSLLSEPQREGLVEWLKCRSLHTDGWRDHRSRWAYWRGLTVHEWLCDDGSGGKTNGLLPRPSTRAIDEVCWDLSLSTAERVLGDHPTRLARAWWLADGGCLPGESGEGGAAEPKGCGRHDFFKLLVWDLITDFVLHSQPRLHVKALLSDLRPKPGAERMRQVAAWARDADVAVLLEVPGHSSADATALAGLEDEFWQVRAAEADPEMNTVIFARRSLFLEPGPPELFHHDDGRINPRLLGATLRYCRSRPEHGAEAGHEIHVLGVHLAGSGHDARHVQRQLESRLRTNTVLSGDFNTDVRSDQAWLGLNQAQLPKLGEMLAQASSLPSDLGTCNKQRSPFQAQVSKMLLRDFTMKDFLVVGAAFQGARVDGLIQQWRTLPDEEVPSDHAPLEVHLRFKQDIVAVVREASERARHEKDRLEYGGGGGAAF